MLYPLALYTYIYLFPSTGKTCEAKPACWKDYSAAICTIFFCYQGEGSVSAGFAEVGENIVVTRFTNAGCKEGDEIKETVEQENPEIFSTEWEVDDELITAGFRISLV